MTERTVLPRLMYIPELLWTCLRERLRVRIDKFVSKPFSPQRRNPVKEKCQNFITLNLVAAYHKYPKEDEHH
jgi:hypothetical protein